MTHLWKFILGATWMLCAQSHAETVEWLAFPVGLNHELTVTSAGVQPLRVPVRYATGAASTPDNFDVRVFDVSGRQGRSDEIAGQFKASWRAAKPEQAMALLLEVKPVANGLLPGAYAVAVDIAPDFKAVGAKVQTVTFSLTVTAPTVSAASIVLHQTRVLNEAGDSTPVVLALTEDSGKAAASRLRVTASRDTAEKDHDDTGVLIVPSTVAPLGPKAAASIPISVSGTFGLGKTAGKLKIESPELAAATIVPFEVHARRHPFWIGVLAVVGVLLGYGVRVVLVKRGEMVDADIAAGEVIDGIKEQLQATDDATATAALQNLLNSLEAMSKRKDAKALTDLAKKSADEAAAVRTALNDELKKVVPEVEGAHLLVDRKWSVIPGAQTALDDLIAATGDLDRLLARRNAVRVKVVLGSSLREKLAAYVSARKTHMSQLAAFFQAMANKPPPLPTENVDSLKELAKELSAAYPASAGNLQTITVDEAGVELARLEAELSRCEKVASNVASQAIAFVTLAQHKLLQQADDPRGTFADVRDATVKLLGAEALSKDIADPQNPTANYPATILQLAEVWKAALVAVVPTAKRAVVGADIRTKVDQGDWQAAIDVAEQEVPQGGVNLGAVNALVNAAKVLLLDGGGARIIALPEKTVATRGYEMSSVLTGGPAQRAFLVAKAKRAKFIQSMILAAVFVAGLYAFYEETWVGTLKEMIALFLVAFGVDLTYDGVAGELKKGKPAGT